MNSRSRAPVASSSSWARRPLLLMSSFSLPMSMCIPSIVPRSRFDSEPSFVIHCSSRLLRCPRMEIRARSSVFLAMTTRVPSRWEALSSRVRPLPPEVSVCAAHGCILTQRFAVEPRAQRVVRVRPRSERKLPKTIRRRSCLGKDLPGPNSGNEKDRRRVMKIGATCEGGRALMTVPGDHRLSSTANLRHPKVKKHPRWRCRTCQERHLCIHLVREGLSLDLIRSQGRVFYLSRRGVIGGKQLNSSSIQNVAPFRAALRGGMCIARIPFP